MPKTAITTTDAPAPVASYSQAVRKGNILQVAGQGPSDPVTGEFVGTSIAEQTRQTMRNIQAILRGGRRRLRRRDDDAGLPDRRGRTSPR